MLGLRATVFVRSVIPGVAILSIISLVERHSDTSSVTTKNAVMKQPRVREHSSFSKARGERFIVRGSAHTFVTRVPRTLLSSHSFIGPRSLRWNRSLPRVTPMKPVFFFLRPDEVPRWKKGEKKKKNRNSFRLSRAEKHLSIEQLSESASTTFHEQRENSKRNLRLKGNGWGNFDTRAHDIRRFSHPLERER